MSRPIKNYCDYFSHDRDMRNHRKIKAIRNKFKVIGYSVWCMLLEYLTGTDGNVIEYSDIEFELMAGDFEVSATEIREIVDYCLILELLILKDGFLNSDGLDERLSPVYEKRNEQKSKSKKQLRADGKFATDNTVPNGVSAPEKPQSKVNKSKVNKSKQATDVSGTEIKSEVVGVISRKPKYGVKRIQEEKNIIDPFGGQLKKWDEWKVYKKREKRFTYKTELSENEALEDLFKISNGNLQVAEKIIKQSIAKGWSGLFELKDTQFSKKQKDLSGGLNTEKTSDHYDDMK